MMDPGVASEIVSGDVCSNNGAILENCIACALRDFGHPIRFLVRTILL